MALARDSSTDNTPMVKPAWCGEDNTRIQLLVEVASTISAIASARDDRQKKARGELTQRLLVAAALVNAVEAQTEVGYIRKKINHFT
jgi:hypothetical protein